MKFFYCFIFSLLSITISAQVSFDKGFYVNNNGEKIECYIKNKNWKKYPNFILTKKNLGSNAVKIDIAEVRSFQIGEALKFVRKNVLIDNASDNLQNLEKTTQFNFVKETIFLRYLIEGEKNLLHYSDGNTNKYFYYSKIDTLQQLAYKRVYVGNEGVQDKLHLKVVPLNEYKVQLGSLVNCGKETELALQSLEYLQKPLVKYFRAYYECSGKEYTDFLKLMNKTTIAVSPKFGVQLGSYKFNVGNFKTDAHIDLKISYRIGAEFEFNFPFDRYRWSLLLNPMFQTYKGNGTFDYVNTASQTLEGTVELVHNSVEFPILVRRYFFLKNRNALFIQAGTLIDFNFNSYFSYDRFNNLRVLAVSGTSPLVFGLGYRFKERVALEFHYNLPRMLAQITSTLNAYQNFSINFSYAIFRKEGKQILAK